MAKIFFPFIDRPKGIPFLLDRKLRFPFVIENMLYFWTFEPEGITVYLHSEDISEQTPILKDVLIENTGITFYLANGSVGTQALLAKMVYIEFEQIGKGIHTLGRLDPLTLGEIDPFTLGEISNVSANWKALRNAIVSAMSSIDSSGEDLYLRLDSDSVVTTEKAIFTGKLSSFIHTTGLRKQRIMTLGELDPYVLEDIDMMLTTFRVFENVPAEVVKGISVTHRSALKNALAANAITIDTITEASDSSIQLDGGAITIYHNIAGSASDAQLNIDVGEDISLDSNIDLVPENAPIQIEAGGDGVCGMDILVFPSEHKSVFISSEITLELTTTETT